MATEIGRRFSTAVVLYHGAVAERFGLSATDWKCGEILLRMGPMNPTQLAALTGMSTAAVTLVIDRLEQAGFARRERDPNDRRRVLVYPTATPEIEQKVEEVFRGLTEKMEALMDRYSPQQLQAIVDFIQQTTRLMESETDRLRREAAKRA
ncbi:MarR family transcriptional regulator [Rubrobacter xylanophilus]|uniref:MarR family transcriptional regulator n=1 Tax=Rubrobacter xylanophilus TaxID=49319 RepID=UPI001C63F3B5|nr:MarR family transcriptional regulator [Rubrobacter xylanophilus]